MALILDLLRPDDLLALRVAAVNLKLDARQANDPHLVVIKARDPAYLLFGFPPQSIAERAYYQAAPNLVTGAPGGDPFDPPGGVPASMAGMSRIVLRLPKGMTAIRYQLASLLDWSKLELVVSAAATGAPGPGALPLPGFLETALEIPWRLILSPGRNAGFLHASDLRTFEGRTELWHTRLAQVVRRSVPGGSTARFEEASVAHPVPLRAIWSPDFEDHAVLPDAGDEGAFRTSTSPRDRAEIVILTTGKNGYYVAQEGGAAAWTPAPIRASRLFLSSLGGWLSSSGSWAQHPSFRPRDGDVQTVELSAWVHLATQGRDHYVRIVDEGYLYPFGHRAAVIKVSERKIVPPDGAALGSPTAYLEQREYIVVREPERSYPATSFVHAGREMPFARGVRFRTHVTPDIDKPEMVAGTEGSFWVMVGGAKFPFELSATDLAGATIDLPAPAIFVSLGETNIQAVHDAYATTTDRGSEIHGRKIAYADPAAGDTLLRTTGLLFGAQLLSTAPPFPVAPFVPVLASAVVTVPALEHLLGVSSPVTIELYAGYLAGGLDAHAGVYADITSGAVPVQWSADKAGGLATPNLSLTALSARKGLVSGKADDAAAGIIKPSEFFGDLGAKLFGTIPLSDLIPVDHLGGADAATCAPEIRSQLLPDAKSPQTIVTRIKWAPVLQDYSAGALTVHFDAGSALTLDVKLSRSLAAGGAASSQAKGELKFFWLTFENVIGLKIDSLKFTSENGQKSLVVAKLPSSKPVQFIGALSFVQQLADVLPPGLFGGLGPSIELQPTKLRVTYTIGLPPIAIGVFSLEHIAIMVGLDLPYLDGKPAFEFAFASRGSPFLLTVECLGGGGFVHVVVDADGVQMVEGALEFGGKLSFDIGVASGGVHAMAGIYFQLKSDYTEVTGFVDIGGEVSVLGIISISIDLNLSLSYEDAGGKQSIKGRATLTVSIHVLFFSVSVELSVEKRFGSGPGDPRVGQVLEAADWSSYAAAFA